MQFPLVNGSNLEGRRFQLPGDLEGPYNIVVMPFEMWQQALVDSWTPALARLTGQYPGLRSYELPALPPYGWFEQRRIDGWMRLGIPDRAVRARTITLYLDLPPFLAALGIPDTRTAHLLLLDRAGQVLWRTAGGYAPDKLAGLEDALAVAYAGSAPQAAV